ncbi:hypothetical protein [Solitalea lacus]|uniref:hypothetical protein n=1 Tax=Solitalea lacus TaxID=2911172 RepID=UPI001EDA07E6|nr:hypothetical protein [Solitalea lacus]UKJ06088.1 hypothetical protein L2B55_11070 [Solitalea lacus]
MKRTLSLVILLLIGISLRAQYTTVPTKKDSARVADSLKNIKYPYIFPALGQKAASKGFKFPLPNGLMLNTIYTKQDIKINGLEVGFNSTELINLDSIVVFDYVTGEGYITNFRFDTYLFPFFNVYALGGTLNGETIVQLAEPVSFRTVTSNPGQYYGFGLMLAGGIGKLWVTGDINFAWTDLDLLDRPVKTRVVGIRVGRTFNFNEHPKQNIAIWVTAQNQKIFNETNGQISFKELGLDGDKINDLQSQLDDWYNNLTPPLKELYENVYTRLKDGLETASNTLETGYVRYHFSKGLYTPWHFSIGGQWQINPRWQIRGEFGGAYKKQQYMLSVGYRFGIKGKNIMSGEKKK